MWGGGIFWGGIDGKVFFNVLVTRLIFCRHLFKYFAWFLHLGACFYDWFVENFCAFWIQAFGQYMHWKYLYQPMSHLFYSLGISSVGKNIHFCWTCFLTHLMLFGCSRKYSPAADLQRYILRSSSRKHVALTFIVSTNIVVCACFKAGFEIHFFICF